METSKQWRDIYIRPDLYEISSLGEVRNKRNGHILKQPLGTNGRPRIGVYDKATKHTINVYTHVAACIAFHGPRPEGEVVSHVDGNVMNNSASNLIWETQKKNLSRRVEHGTMDSGLRNSRSVVTKSSLTYIREQLALGRTQASIAAELAIARTVVTRIANGTRYGDF